MFPIVPRHISIFTLLLTLIFQISCGQSSNNTQGNSDLDKRVEKFLADNRNDWRDMNVPQKDGQTLYDIIVNNNYTSALEIGTSTGHSTVWLAWAMSKTGGKVITIEIDERRYKEALNNLEEAGLSDYVDARLADAHKLVKELKGPFDFVFIDADKNWYTQYFKDIDPQVSVNGCITAHNVTNRFEGTREFLDYIQSLSNYTTEIDRKSRSGISISYKKQN